ncbi:MAG: hypothetical protein ACHP9Y_03970, partial [Gammaproteobacteria bacterium]
VSFGIILTLVLLSIIISSDLVLLDDIRDGTVTQLFLSGVSLQKLIVMKFLFFTTVSLMFAYGALLMGSGLLGLIEPNYFLILTFVVPAIMQVIIMASLIVVKTNSKMMGVIIALPFLVSPIIIGIIAATNSAFIALLLAMNLFFIPMTLFFGSLLLRKQLNA